jgi:thiamine-phosphate pyrophosphorylase
VRRDPDYLKVYLVTDRDLSGLRSLADIVEEAIAGGVTAVQLREKELGARRFLEEAREFKELLLGTEIPLFINDRVDVAMAIGADGIHVGQDDLPADQTRRLVGPEVLVGVSVATPEEARQAITDGADYLSVSPVFLTPTKPDADHAVGLQGVTRIRHAAEEVPVLAIGGIDSTNARSVVEAGADGVAVVSAIVAADDPERAARALRFEVEAGYRQRGGIR